MATAYTSLLGLALPVTGELQGTWGTTVNDSITSLLDTAVAGTTTLSTDGDVTLSTTTGASNQARQAILLCSGARTAQRTITAPAQSKIYTVINATTGGFSVKLVGVGPTTGITIVPGESALVAWNGSDFIKVSNTGGTTTFTNVTVSGTTTLSGLTASTALALNASKEVVSVTNTGTGNNVLSASPTLTGTVGMAAATLSSDLTLSGGTANGVLYLNGSKVATSGSALTFDGTNTFSLVTAVPKIAINGTAASGTGARGIDFQYNGTSYGDILLNVNTGELEIVSGQTSQSGYFQTFKINGSEQMRLNSTGLGIGTSSPAAKLHVSGGRTLAITGNESYSLGIGRESNTNSYYLGVHSTTNPNLLFSNNAGTTNMTLTYDGNLGLGVTPSAWGAGSQALQNGGGAVFQYNNDRIFLGQNNYIDSAFADKFIGNGYATRYRQYQGTHAFYVSTVSNSSGAGASASFTQAMTLDASGRLLAGVTTASSGARATFGSAAQASGSACGDSGILLTSTANLATGEYAPFITWSGNATNPNRARAAIGAVSTSATSALDLVFLTRSAADASEIGTGSERARITSGGDLWVGITTAISPGGLTASNVLSSGTSSQWAAAVRNSTATTPWGLSIQYSGASPNGTSSTFLFCEDSTATRATIRSNGGIANYQANDVNLSDRREKTNFAPAKSYLDTICAIPVQTFNYVDQNLEDDPGLTLGVVAQDVQAVAPELVMESNWGTADNPKMRLSIYQTDLQYALMKCVQELKAELDAVKAELATLKGN